MKLLIPLLLLFILSCENSTGTNSNSSSGKITNDIRITVGIASDAVNAALDMSNYPKDIDPAATEVTFFSRDTTVTIDSYDTTVLDLSFGSVTEQQITMNAMIYATISPGSDITVTIDNPAWEPVTKTVTLPKDPEIESTVPAEITTKPFPGTMTINLVEFYDAPTVVTATFNADTDDIFGVSYRDTITANNFNLDLSKSMLSQYQSVERAKLYVHAQNEIVLSEFGYESNITAVSDLHHNLHQ